MRVAVIDDDALDQERLLALLGQWSRASGMPLAPAPAVFSGGRRSWSSSPRTASTSDGPLITTCIEFDFSSITV